VPVYVAGPCGLRAGEQARGALLLFLINVGAILLSGLVVMAIYRVRATAAQGWGTTRRHPRLAVAVVVAFVVALAGPLAVAPRRSPRMASRTAT